MKSSILTATLLLLLTACNNSNESSAEKKSDSDMDAARNFLDAALKGNYDQAAVYMVRDSTNVGYLEATRRQYAQMGEEEKRNLKEASLRFFDPLLQNDSTTITVFANSYKNEKDTLRIVKQQGKWLVDLKYLFEHDRDTSINSPSNKIDTIQ